MNTTCLIVMTNLTHAVLQAGVNYVLASAVHMVIHFQKVTITQALFPFPLTIYNLVRCTTISCEHPDSIEWLKKPIGLFGGIHLLQMKKRIVCDKEPKLVCSEVQWTEELDITFHRVLIRGTFQRVPAASEGLFKAELINIPSGLSAYCQYPSWLQESSPQTATTGFESSYPVDRSAK